MSLLERVRAIRDAYYNECRDRRNLFDERGRRLDHPSDKGAGASYPRPRVRRGVWRRGVAGMSGNDDEDADESGDSEQEDSSGEESDTESEESGDSEDDEDEDDTEGSAEGNRQRGSTIPNQPGSSSRPHHPPHIHLPRNPSPHLRMAGHQQRSYERWIPPQETMRQTNRAQVTAKTSKAVDHRYDIWLPANMASRQPEKGKPPTI